MLVKVLSTTDNKHVGEEYNVPGISHAIMLGFGMKSDVINWYGNICIVQSKNYTIKIIKL